jgi:hypothetical protein
MVTVSPDTALPALSSTWMVRVEVPAGFTASGAALSVTVLAAPAVKLTLMVSLKPPALA